MSATASQAVQIKDAASGLLSSLGSVLARILKDTKEGQFILEHCVVLLLALWVCVFDLSVLLLTGLFVLLLTDSLFCQKTVQTIAQKICLSTGMIGSRLIDVLVES